MKSSGRVKYRGYKGYGGKGLKNKRVRKRQALRLEIREEERVKRETARKKAFSNDRERREIKHIQ
jgi:hypothetical protein